MRHERRSKAIPALAEHLEEMGTIVERNRTTRRDPSAPATSNGNGPERKLLECVAVMVWQEEDGSETVSVVGDAEVSDIELKGVLHDGIYAMTHMIPQTA